VQITRIQTLDRTLSLMAGVDPVGELVLRARDGDAEAFAGLYDLFHARLYRFFVANVRNRTEAEDLAAEVFVEAAQRIRTFEGSGPAFAGWLFAMARNDLADIRRRLRRRVVEPFAEPPEPGHVEDPADAIVSRLDAGAILWAVEHLTDDQRHVITLKFAGGLSNDEIAEATGKPLTAVKSLQHRALATLKRLITEAGI
jgi:RNA polymerase sigma-70 factor, ECF subfamily